MRRAPIVVTATVLGTAGVLLFKPIPTTSFASAGGGATAGTSAGTSTGSSSDGSPSDDTSGTSGTVQDGTYTGAAETSRFGTTQVEVTISGGRITEVAAVQLNQDDPRSTQISEAAVPTLRSEVLSEQTAAVDTVSGATYTTAAYEASLQSALDEAGYTAPDGSTASTDISNLNEAGRR